MAWDDGAPEPRQAGLSGSAVAERGASDPPQEWADLAAWARWLERRWVVLVGVALIAASLIWKAHFLSGLYFRQDDFHLLDRAIENPLSWKQLTFIGAGHLIPGPYLVAWFVARVSLYSWALASAVSLAFVAAASLAGLRLLRTLFGDRPGILIPLLIYLICPLTLPDLGIWSSALESVPLQLATFMALTAHIHYVRTERTRELLWAAFWVMVGLFFFEKGLVLPLLLFAVTSGFLLGGGSWLAAARRCAVRYWKAWLVYAVLIVGYSVVLKVSLKTSAAQPGSPGSVGRVLTFMSDLIRYTFVPGAIGGPFRWFPIQGGSYSFVATPSAMVWISGIIAVLVLLVSVLYRRIAWRAWATLCGWILVADMLPVIVGRLGHAAAIVLGLESRYVADAVPVLAICIGLAFWPVISGSPAVTSGAQPAASAVAVATRSPRAAEVARVIAAVAVGAFVLCSLWSVQVYGNVTTGAFARGYIDNARMALRQAPRGTVVIDNLVPEFIVLNWFGRWAHASTVVGDMASGKPPGRLHWVRRPAGTVDNLMIFGADGRLHLASVYGIASLPRPAGRNCWPQRHGVVRVPFYGASSASTELLRVGYLRFSLAPGYMTVSYGGTTRQVRVEPGLHSAYVPEHGSARSATVSGFGGVHMCIGDAEAGYMVASGAGPTIPQIVP